MRISLSLLEILFLTEIKGQSTVLNYRFCQIGYHKVSKTRDKIFTINLKTFIWLGKKYLSSQNYEILFLKNLYEYNRNVNSYSN